MRKFLILVLAGLASLGVHAWEPTTADLQSEPVPPQASYAEALVTVAPVPMPARVVELARYSAKSTGVRPTKAVKVGKLVRVKSILSRSAREQIALAATRTKPDDRMRLRASDDEDADTGIDELDLHRSFSRPRVAESFAQADDADEVGSDLSDHVKLRLLMARSKAVEAHVLAQAGKASGPDEPELSETVKLRLFLARARAVRAHGERFGAA